jgi:hypothetical protein
MASSGFISFMDGGFEVPPHQEIDDQDDPGIPHMPDLDQRNDGFLQFKYRTVEQSGTLSVKLNNVQFKDIPFGQSDAAVARVWFETIKGRELDKVHNSLDLTVGGPGKVRVSDFKIFYHT